MIELVREQLPTLLMSCYNKLVNIVFKSKYQPIPDEVEVVMFQPQKLRDFVVVVVTGGTQSQHKS